MSRRAGEDPERWFNLKVAMSWNQGWAAEQSEWQPSLSRFRDTVTGLIDALRRHQLAEGPEAAQRVAELFTERKVAPFYLPDLPRDDQVFRAELVRRLAGVLGTAQDPVAMIAKLLGPSFWADVLDNAAKMGTDRALAQLRRAIDSAIWRFTRNGSLLMPQIADLLTAVAGMSASGVSAKERERFRNRLDGFILPGLLPEARGTCGCWSPTRSAPRRKKTRRPSSTTIPGQARSQRSASRARQRPRP